MRPAWAMYSMPPYVCRDVGVPSSFVSTHRFGFTVGSVIRSHDSVSRSNA